MTRDICTHLRNDREKKTAEMLNRKLKKKSR